MDLLDGKVIIVVGASRGIGRGIALAAGKEGARVVAAARTFDADSKPKIEINEFAAPGSLAETVAEIKANGGKALGFKCDVLVD